MCTIGVFLVTESEWVQLAKRCMKVELVRRGLSYEDMRLKLEKIGVEKSEQNLRTTINRGTFSFAFFLQCMRALEMTKFSLD